MRNGKDNVQARMGCKRPWFLPLALCAGLLLLPSLAAADQVELLSGTKVAGRIVERTEQSVTIQAEISGRVFTRKYPVSRIHAIVTDEGREVLNTAEETGRESSRGSQTTGSSIGSASAASGRSQADIEALIAEQGSTPPDWWKSTPLSYPQSLDLSFKEPAPGPWNSQKNVGQYLWDVINPNPNRWREGIRLIDHILEVNKNDPHVRFRSMNTLGRMYFTLMQDYARAAYWWHKAGIRNVALAECYWRLGSKPMAMNLLERIDLQYSTIKLLADMGETQLAIRTAQANTRGPAADMAYLYAGDACRVAGQHAQALEFYEKVLTVPATGQGKDRIGRNHQRAQANIEAIRLYHLLDLSKVPDGTYRASSPAYAGELRIEVTVRSGRIEEVKVVEHHEKQFYSAISDTTRKIIAKQAVAGIDATSQATITSEAIINATAKALAGATK